MVLVGGSRSDRESAERVWPLEESIFLAAAIWAFCPFNRPFWQDRFAKLSDNFGLRFLKLFQQRWIGFENMEVGVVQQHQVLNRFEGVAPLPVRTEYFFDEMKIFQRQTELLSTGFEEIKFIRRVRPRLPAGQNQIAGYSFLAGNCADHNLL